jgi:transposase
MYVNVSRYKDYRRVRLMRKVVVEGVPKTVLVEHIGSARSDPELAVLRVKAEERMAELRPQLSLLAKLEVRSQVQATDTSRLVMSGSFASGLWQVMGGQYDRIGLPDDLLKYLVLARIATPKSKRATVRYLRDNLNLSLGLQTIYDYMDTLNKDILVNKLLSYAQAKAVAATGTTISVVFYDVTTLYFETDEDDEDVQRAHDDGTVEMVISGLRKKGYSKDHRFDLPQVVVGLTVDSTGFPLDFQIYEGNTYEGHTLLKGVKTIQQKLKLENTKLTVVADAGMLSKTNLDELENQGYSYIVGARIRSLARNAAKQITSWDYEVDGAMETVVDHRRLIVTCSEKRAKRSRHNRELLVKKLQAKLDRGQVIKKSKYVILDTVEQSTNSKQPPKFSGHIDQEKLEADAQFDGLKGYITNTELLATEVIAYYSTLWNVEKSFRMSKSDLRARPTFHYKRERVIAHLVICVCALAVLREFERKLCILPAPATPKLGLSVALEELLAIRAYTLRLASQQQVTVYSELTKLQERLLEM